MSVQGRDNKRKNTKVEAGDNDQSDLPHLFQLVIK